MKNNIFLLIAASIFILSFSSCDDLLDVTPKDKITPETFFSTESDLQAYWKFDEGTGNSIIDRTGHHNDAKMIPYFTDGTYTQPRLKTEAELWPSGVEVPIMNK